MWSVTMEVWSEWHFLFPLTIQQRICINGELYLYNLLELIFWSLYPYIRSGLIVWAIVTVTWFVDNYDGTASRSDPGDLGGTAPWSD